MSNIILNLITRSRNIQNCNLKNYQNSSIQSSRPVVQNGKDIKKKNSVYSLLKGNYFATKAAHTVVLRANQRGVKMLRKKMAKAAQNSTPPQVVKSYCWYIGWKKVSLNSHILTLIDLAMNQNSLFLKLKDLLTVPH